MKAKSFICGTLVFLLSIFIIDYSYSCTTFCIHTDDELVFGKNYDWMISYGIVFVNKKDVVKTAFTKQSSAASWVSRYGSITFNQFGKEFPMGGMNEAGLVVELMWLDETKYPEKDDRPTTGGILQWIQYQLDNSATVKDVIDSDKNIRIPSKSIPVHYLIADKNGNTASIEFLDGKLIHHTGETMMYKTLTNDTYEKSIEYLKKHSDFGGTKTLSESKSSLDRFVKACSMIKYYSKKPGEEAVDYGFNILNNVSQGEYTKWSIIYDIKNLKVYFKTSDNQNIKNIDLSLLEFSCSSPVKMFNMNSALSGNINLSMVEYTYEANRNLIEDSYNGVDFLKNESKEERDMAAEYPQKLNCRSKSSIDKIPNGNHHNAPILIAAGLILSSAFFIFKYKTQKNKI